jgi:tetratricopeptide (TPR) repeat protein
MDSGEGESVRTLHRDFYLALAERAEPHLEGREFGIWLDILVRENDNLRAALEWSLSDDSPEAGLRIAGALTLFWQVRGDSSEAFRWLEPLLSREGPTAPQVRAKTLRYTAQLTARQGDLVSSKRLVEEAAALSRSAGDDAGLGRALGWMGSLRFWEGDTTESESLLEESLSLARASGDAYAQGQVLDSLGSFASVRGDHPRARRLYEDALTVARSLGSPIGIVRSLIALADEADPIGDYATEGRLLEEALDLARQTGDTAATWWILARLTRLAEIRGESSVAAEFWEEASRIVREAGDVFWLHNLGYMAGERGDYETCLSLFQECLARYRELGAADGVGFELNNAGWVTYLLGDTSAARPLIEESISIHRSGAPRKTFLAASTHSLGEVLRALGDLDGARPLLEESLSLSKELGIKLFVVTALFSLGEMARAEKDLRGAMSLLAEGLRVAHEAVETQLVSEGLERMGGLAAAESHFRRAARLFGAAEALRESMHKPMPPVRVPEYERAVAAVRSGLEPGGFEESWADGRSMTPDEIFEYALGQ